ncbi:microcephalin isoform X2 [Lucilia cuprina]|uniref:microcephalin isoform X2 n=1 Tax=Lucilia cuprina TaxID=7375 RepID=UPI001F065932|nr:microcephalin isoform X2 [Lucilia cuprina]
MCTKFVVFTGKLADYIDCPVEKENDTYMTITGSPKTHNKVVETGLQLKQTLETNKVLTQQVQGTPERPALAANSMLMARIQRDLNSPSAAARMKALKAMKSPTKSAYNHFDIPEAEQSLHIPEPPSLQEIMRNIVVYVEVRSGEDNRSAGVRKVIEALGARVNLSLNRDTTHVIFKDGLMSTFKKAKQMNVPIVSILWIEACKNQRRICDPKDYPISNLDRYENPELYTKMKRVKSMQPDSECNKRIRAKAGGGGTPKDTTPNQKTGNLKKTSTLIGGTPTSSTNKKKTDISQFFKKLERATPTSTSKVNGGGDITPMPESPATQLLNRIHSECYTPLTELKKKTASSKENNNNNIENNNEKKLEENDDNSSNIRMGVKKTLNFLPGDTVEASFSANVTTRRRSNSVVMQQKSTVDINCVMEESSPLPKGRGRTRRHSLMSNHEIEATTNSLVTMAITATPNKSTRRRSSIHTPKNMSTSMAISETPNKINNIEPILEETNEMEKEPVEQTKSVTKRRTLYAAKTMEQTELLQNETHKDIEINSTKTTRRRTLYAHKTMETSEINEVVDKVLSNVSTRRRTCLNLKSLEQTEIKEAMDSTNTPDKRTPLVNSKILELNNEVEMKTPPTTKADKTISRRRTLYGAQTINATVSSPNVTAGSSICITPTNFQTGKVASSTLLEDSGNRSKLVATPPADATTGKLLEETEQCATPLIFSSTRQPTNKRRTLFDVSMDIITQRLQCINQSARRSLAPPTPSAEVAVSTPLDIRKTNNSSIETLNECTNSNDGLTSVSTPETNTLKKKRKLFMPEMLVTPPPAVANETAKESETLANKTANTNSVTKRRRTLMPISQPQPTTSVKLKESTASLERTPNARKRRSTLDFEQIKNMKTNKEDASSSSSQESVKTKKQPVLVYTNMHQQQIDVIREAINKLGVFSLESTVTDTTTHLVSLEPRRTLNLLRALTRGLWILEYSWILDSLKAGHWLAEEPHELKDFSRGIEICRSERQAFGNNYKCDLFHKFGAFYISSQCCPISKENMCELIKLCGGRVVNARQKARYIIGDANRTLEDKFYLTPYWVLDSITQMQLMKIQKYMYPLPDATTASSQPLPVKRNT